MAIRSLRLRAPGSQQLQCEPAVYNNIKYLHSYEAWPYKDVLQARLTSAQAWSATFADERDVKKHPQQLRGSAISCTVCHGA